VPPSISSELIPKFEMYKPGKLPAVETDRVSRALKDHGQVTPQVSFREFGKGKPQPVISGLERLFKEIGTIVDVFAREV
jgi:hypothetical protein